MVRRIINLNLAFFFLIYVLITKVNSSEVLRPLGVPLSRASLFNPNKEFVCFDGSSIFPFTYVNDDYCDCPDASDEPGTSACPHGTFHCTNAGHKPQNIPSSRVGDGVCDCCDGSDEHGNFKVKCTNNCLELGRSAREEAQRRAELIKAGKQQRAELSQMGKQLKQGKRERLEALQKHKVDAEKVRESKEAVKKTMEQLESDALEKHRKIEEEERRRQAEIEKERARQEASDTFVQFDSNKDGKVDLKELQTRQTFDKDRNGEVSEEEAKYFLNGQESVDPEYFIENCWVNIKPFFLRDAGLYQPPSATGEEEDLEPSAGEEGEGEEEGPEGEAELDHEADDEGEAEEEQEEELHEQPTPSSKYDEETQSIIETANDARQDFTQIDQQVKDMESEIKKLEEYLETDFGPDEEFATLQGECFEYSDHEYVYKLCPFEKATQKQKSSSVETRLGTWARWLGPNDNKYEKMLFDNGQSCWNGPQRQTKVVVNCGGENRLISVSEPNRCEYLFEFVTPAACREVATESQDDLHDEL